MTAVENLVDLMTGSLSAEQRRVLRRIGEIGRQLSAAGYLVDGSVRDLLLGRRTPNLQVAVEGSGVALARAVARSLRGHLVPHPGFGTATVRLDSLSFDIATSRQESYSVPGALPLVRPAPICTDLARRDFTINAMAVSLSPGHFGDLIDPVGGRTDLKAGLIRVLHAGSFRDDPTRLLRAVRFQAGWGMRLEEQTEALAKEAAAEGALNSVSGDRLREELVLLLSEEQATTALQQASELGLLESLDPGLRFSSQLNQALERVPWAIQSLERWREEGEPIQWWLVRLLALADPLSTSEVRRVAARLKCPRFPRKALSQAGLARESVLPVLEAGEEISPSELYRLLEKMPREVLAYLLAVSPSDRVRERVELFVTKLSPVRPSVTGYDLLSLGYRGGPALRAALERILDAKLEGLVNSREAELELGRRMLQRPLA